MTLQRVRRGKHQKRRIYNKVMERTVGYRLYEKEKIK